MLAIGCDHGGFELKQVLIDHLKARGVEVKDFGCYSADSVDYPTIAEPVCNAIVGGECEKGILICGTGIGMSLAANKVKGIRAACCENSFSARMSREHNNAHILCLGARVTGPSVAMDMVDAFLDTEFAGGRHANRVNLITEIENK
ncbi:MAG: ribose 5-phosphate isomerase B [Clostridiales bacterium]|nr:ribose 5-phosphate isomerase B [Clostridiales bacterium]